MDELATRWSVDVLGDYHGARVWTAPASDWVHTTTGWGTGYASIALLSIDVATGEQTGMIRTRSREVTALTLAGGDLLAATDKRLWTLDPRTLEERHQQDVRMQWPSMIIATDDVVVLANWVKSGMLFVDRHTGESTKRRTPPQGSLGFIDGEWRLHSAWERGYGIVDLAGRKVIKGADCDPVFAIHADVEHGRAWARSVAGPDPRSGVTQLPGEVLTHLPPDDTAVWVSADTPFVVVDGAREELWTAEATYQEDMRSHTSVVRCLSGTDGDVRGEWFVPGFVADLDLRTASVISLDVPSSPRTDGRPSHRVVCFDLPQDGGTGDEASAPA